ncbi:MULTISPECIES: hypothetical protein [unclassified Pseudovibrio]|uniref:hypothetical protein n=1 Tax=unclassified Pseudovibrio TaxID=2627060 RepID=UPI0007AEA971|nr:MULTISPECIES: hypothetical protein [unclassified Pseudovibrio]KZK96757.1 hypothetical protein PsAD26_05729 [Pseudovibrio sp. Ad26]KZL11997.1 hypothetical protein PsAD14_00163 [Pseudovibrio sp. Ad14]
MDDTACACGATNTLQNEFDDVNVAVSDLQNLAYVQHMVLSERMKNSCERDVLFTLHYALCNRLEALDKTCGILTDALSGTSFPKGFSGHATRSVASPPPVETNIVSLD